MRHTKTEHSMLDSERREELYAYFDLAWEIFVRLEQEGKLDSLHLTNRRLNPTVTSEDVLPQNQPN